MRSPKALFPLPSAVRLFLVLLTLTGVLSLERLAASPPAGGVLTRQDVLAWQVALESRGFSPGLLDGILGPKTATATRLYQAVSGLPVTGNLCRQTATSLGLDLENGRPVSEYRILAEDERQVEYCPPDWHSRSRRKKLLYSSLVDCLAEKFHTSERCLARLNPAQDLRALAAGKTVLVPALPSRRARPSVASLEIDLARKVVVLLDSDGGPAGLLHCSVAEDLSRVKRGETRVVNVVENPEYTFDPAKWPEVKDVKRTLVIPPGPRSPVGSRWIGLGLDGVGIHGTWNPAHIGKTGSHGCFRLTNWDAAWLASLVSAGTRVQIVNRSAVLDRLVGRE